MAEDSIKNLTPATPGDTGPAGEGDNELRNLKTILQLHWPALDAVINNTGATGGAGDTDPPDAATWSKLFEDVRALTGNVGAIGSVPLGGILMWSGLVGSIPAGWALCDGNSGQPINGVAIPDLTDKFIMGAGNTYSIGEEGGNPPGSATTESAGAHTHSTGGHSLSLAELPTQLSDAVQLALTTGGGGSDGINHNDSNYVAAGSGLNVNSGGPVSVTGLSGAQHDHGNTGSDGAHVHAISGQSYPPFIALGFIIYVGA